MTFVGAQHLLQQTGSVLYGLRDYAVVYKYIAVVCAFYSMLYIENSENVFINSSLYILLNR
jgi:hypothetical protein